MQKILSNLWFDYQAEEAAHFYTGIFENAKIGTSTYYSKAGFEIHGQTEGKLMTIEFELAGHSFVGLNGGPLFSFTPAISFLVGCKSKDEVDTLWAQLIVGGSALMDLGEYPFSTRYGWLNDKYGISWQLMYTGKNDVKQSITPTLMFVGAQAGKAAAAIKLYTSIFPHSAIDHLTPYGKTAGPDKEGDIMHAGFSLEGQPFAAMDSSLAHHFTFTEAIALTFRCESQAEIDYYWDKLTEGGDPSAQQCGWLKDKFGVSWIVESSLLCRMLLDSDKEKVERVTNAFLKMKKFDLAKLQIAFDGK